MLRLRSAIAYFLAGVPLHVRAAMQEGAGSASSDSDAMLWIVLALVAIFGGFGFSTWQLIKSERKARDDKKLPE